MGRNISSVASVMSSNVNIGGSNCRNSYQQRARDEQSQKFFHLHHTFQCRLTATLIVSNKNLTVVSFKATFLIAQSFETEMIEHFIYQKQIVNLILNEIANDNIFL